LRRSDQTLENRSGSDPFHFLGWVLDNPIYLYED